MSRDDYGYDRYGEFIPFDALEVVQDGVPMIVGVIDGEHCYAPMLKRCQHEQLQRLVAMGVMEHTIQPPR